MHKIEKLKQRQVDLVRDINFPTPTEDVIDKLNEVIDAVNEITNKINREELLTKEQHEKLMETLHEECKKDLPRWKIWRNGVCGNSEGNPIALVKESCGYKLVSYLCADGEKYIMLSDLEKLPGFNDVYHE